MDERRPWFCTCTMEHSSQSCCFNRSEHISHKLINAMLVYGASSRRYSIDKCFPPNDSSLYYRPRDDQRAACVKWKRLCDITTDDCDTQLLWTVFCKPMPSDIIQGKLGNCWILSALAVLAQREDLLKSVVISREFSSNGIYRIRLCKDGRWTSFLVDHIFPCDSEGRLLYSRARGKQLWVPLIEKAFAKMHGCYEALVGGNPIESLAILTGAPCERISLRPSISGCRAEDTLDSDLIWAQLLLSREASFLMCLSCGNGFKHVDEAEYRTMGLCSGHCYSLLDVQSVDEHRLLLLGNPWGKCDWRGRWSNDSSMWTLPLRKQLLPNGPQPGEFWIAFNDVLKYFHALDICKVRKGWNEVRFHGSLLTLESQVGSSCIILTILESTELDVTLFQDGQRNIENSERSHLRLYVALFEGSNTHNVGRLVEHSEHQAFHFVSCNKILGPGTYVVVPLALSHSGTGHPSYALAIHSSRKLLAKQVVPPPALLADAIISVALAKGTCQVYKGIAIYSLIISWSRLLVVVENLCDNEWLKVGVIFEQAINWASTRGALETVDCVPPLHRQVIAILTESVPNTIRKRTSYKHSSIPGLCDWGDKYKGTFHSPELNYQTEGLHTPHPIM